RIWLDRSARTTRPGVFGDRLSPEERGGRLREIPPWSAGEHANRNAPPDSGVRRRTSACDTSPPVLAEASASFRCARFPEAPTDRAATGPRGGRPVAFPARLAERASRSRPG